MIDDANVKELADNVDVVYFSLEVLIVNKL